MTASSKYGPFDRNGFKTVPRDDVPAPRRLPNFRIRRTDGIETIWLEGKRGARMIQGIASTPTINSHKYSLSSGGCRARFPIPVLSGHAKGPPIGEVVLVRIAERSVFVEAIIFEGNPAADHAWKLIESGETRCFSGAADQSSWRLAGEVDGVKFYDSWWLKEVSVCRTGANPDCHFATLLRAPRSAQSTRAVGGLLFRERPSIDNSPHELAAPALRRKGVVYLGGV